MRTNKVWLGALVAISTWFGCTSMLGLDYTYELADASSSGLAGNGGTGGSGGGAVCDPGSLETCNGLDDDCDGEVDENLLQWCGAGSCRVAFDACEECPLIEPKGIEQCDGEDNNCDGTIDEGCACNEGAEQPCYGGSEATRGKGICTDGVQTCTNGAWGACEGQTLPELVELCDGLDNDCNGTIDDPFFGVGDSCVTGLLGPCKPGTMQCAEGKLVCRPDAMATDEICDGIDNNCDGNTDENNPGGGGTCPSGLPGPCSAGTYTCIDGELKCEPKTPAVGESCDNIDNDCDGMVDEDNPGGGSTCNAPGLGECKAGRMQCKNGALVCEPEKSPVAEICNGLDDDCNGPVDNGNPGGDQACNVPNKAGECAKGTTECTGGELLCKQTIQPTSEVCDGKDNDCYGGIDDGNPGGGQQCPVPGKAGECAKGTSNCSNGGLVCTQTIQPTGEVCDGKDNDCNGVPDNGNPGGGQACNTNIPGVCSVGTTDCINGMLACKQNQYPTNEVCDGKDNDCNGVPDNGNPGGGQACNVSGVVGECAKGATVCTGGSLTCFQTKQSTTEVCDGLDNDCDGVVDDGVTTTYYGDADGDGYGNPNNTIQACSLPSGYVTNAADCNDGNANIKPGVPEVCTDPADNDCNGTPFNGGCVCEPGSMQLCTWCPSCIGPGNQCPPCNDDYQMCREDGTGWYPCGFAAIP